MSIEGGARAGLIAPDETTYRLSQGPSDGAAAARIGTPRCAIGRRCAPTKARISTRRSGIDAATLKPIVTWGTSPEDVIADRPVRCRTPPIADETKRQVSKASARSSLHGPEGRHEDDRRQDRHASSSAPAPTAASRTCAPPPSVAKGRKVDPSNVNAHHGWCRARAW